MAIYTIPFFYENCLYYLFNMIGFKRSSDSIVSFPHFSIFFLPIALFTLYPFEERYAFAGKLLIVTFFMVGGLLQKNRWHYLIPLLILCMLFCSLLWSVSFSQSLYGAIQVMYYVLIFSIFRYTTFNTRSLMWGVRILVLVSLILSIDDGLRQIIYGYENDIQYLDSTKELISPTMRQLARDWLKTLSETGRVFSRSALPSQLAGYLLMILPLNFLLILRERFVGVKIFWGVGFLLNCIIFFYTKSFGAWLSFLGILVIGFYLFISQKHIIPWRTVLKGSVCLLLGGWVILYVIGTVRGQYLWDFQGNNPLWFRFLNWKTAIHIFFDHPVLGTGFLTFGKMYPQYMLPGANESQYVHNSYLQIGTELGLVGLVVVVWLVGHWYISATNLLRRLTPYPSKQHSQEDQVKKLFGIGFFFGGVAFLLHNIVDFDFYVFPLGVLGVSLLALTLNVLAPFSPKINSRDGLKRPRILVGYSLISCVLLAMYFIDWQYAHGMKQQEQAMVLAQSSEYEEAYTHIQQALQYASYIPEYIALEGSLLVHLHKTDLAIQRFQSAIQREPDTPWFHAGLAEAYIANHNISMAYVESRRAAELFPQKIPYQKYVQELRLLLSM